MKIDLLYYTPNGISLIARMARSTRKNKLSPNNPDEQKDEHFVKQLLKVQHLGILEHINFTFHVSEISRILTHQLVRHRIASYLQMSSRHAIPERDDFVTPPCFQNNKLNEESYVKRMYSAYDAYKESINSGFPIEDSRYLIPDGYYTHIGITMNCRELIHFFKLRCHKSAQWEIRNLANEMLKICYETYPVIFEDEYKKYCIEKEDDL